MTTTQAEADPLDLVSRLSEGERAVLEHSLNSVSPDDAKYEGSSRPLKPYLTAAAEWMACAQVQRVLLETRMEFGQAMQWHLDEVDAALKKVSPLNMSLLEDKVTRHDQLAVIEEIGRFVSEETKALLHPGTTSYDILDTARSYLFRNAWQEVIRPEVVKSIDTLCGLAERSINVLQVGRTHLQNTSPVTFGLTLARYAARLAERVERCDLYFNDLRGKVSGIVGTGDSIDVVIGEGKSFEFERAALDKLGLKPDLAATQIVHKERPADVGNGLTTIMHVLADFANNIRTMYSSAIGEVTSRDNAERLGGSSADATKNNPINWENIAGKAAVVESGMRVLYAMMDTNFERDLRNSVQARYQPQAMMVQVFEAFSRLNKRALNQLSINEDRIAANLQPVRDNPGEAMTAILRGEKWVHPQYGVGHEFVRVMGVRSIKEKRPLLEVCMEDPNFRILYDGIPEHKQAILGGELEKYVGPGIERARLNIQNARAIMR